MAKQNVVNPKAQNQHVISLSPSLTKYNKFMRTTVDQCKTKSGSKLFEPWSEYLIEIQ